MHFFSAKMGKMAFFPLPTSEMRPSQSFRSSEALNFIIINSSSSSSGGNNRKNLKVARLLLIRPTSSSVVDQYGKMILPHFPEKKMAMMPLAFTAFRDGNRGCRFHARRWEKMVGKWWICKSISSTRAGGVPAYDFVMTIRDTGLKYVKIQVLVRSLKARFPTEECPSSVLQPTTEICPWKTAKYSWE